LVGEYTTVTKPGTILYTGTGAMSNQNVDWSRTCYWAHSTFGLNLGGIALPEDNTCRTNPLACSLTLINQNAVGGGPGTQVTLDPDYNKCSDQTSPTANPAAQPCKRTFAGVHGGGIGMQFVHCDGSVHSVTSTMDMRILSAMATINGGETV